MTTQGPKTVEFVPEPKLETSPQVFNVELREIQSLCTALTDCHRKICSIGFLKCSKDYRHDLYTRPSNICFSGRSLSLFDLLSRNHNTNNNEIVYKKHKLSRKDRKELSVQVAISLLQLYSTPWISEDWSKADIVFESLEETTRSSVLQPYLRRRFSTVTEIPSTSTAKNSQAIVFRLGVLLLELCIGEALEDHYLGSGGHRSSDTEFQTVYDWWAQEARDEEGEEVAEVIRKCLCFEFPTECKSLHNEELRKAMYNEVVRPLREVLHNFTMN